MGQQIIVLGGYTFPYNPYPNKSELLKSSTYTPTINGGYHVTWQPSGGGVFYSDTPIELQFQLMSRTLYLQLETLFKMPGTLTYIDPYATSWTVRFKKLTPQSFIKGGDDAVENVAVILGVVSQP